MEFSTRDPARPEFWDERYCAGFIPWDAQGVPSDFAAFVARGAAGRRVLVPGCGSGYEVALLHARGYAVTAIDIAPQALDRARSVLGSEVAAAVLKQADFFTFDGQYDWIYERALLCALPPALWDRYAEAAERLLVPGGVLAGFFFIDDGVPEPRHGPPFAARSSEVERLFGRGFERVEHRAVDPQASLPVFAGREHWMVWRRATAGASSEDVAP